MCILSIDDKPDIRNLYVILLTARNVKEDLIVGMEAGADDFIGKPFEKLELKARLKAVSRIISLERTLAEKNRKLEFKEVTYGTGRTSVGHIYCAR